MSDSQTILKPQGIPVPLSTSAIEKELAAMWAGEKESSEGNKLTHFSLGTVIWLGTSRFMSSIRKITSEIIHDFPCRLILLECAPDKSIEEIETYISANCYLEKGSRGKVCSEEIHIRFTEKDMQHIKGIVLPLMQTDVPAFFWYFTSKLEHYQELVPAISEMADITIDDIAYRKKPSKALQQMASEDTSAISLAWFCTDPLRDQIASFFDDSRNLSLIHDVATLDFKWFGSQSRKQAIVNASIITGWMADKLGWVYNEDLNYKKPNSEHVSIQITELDGTDLQDCAELSETQIITKQGDVFCLRLASCSGHMNRFVSYKSIDCPDQVTTIKLHMLSEAEALIRLLQVPHSKSEFTKAAKSSWQLLEDMEKRFDL